MAAIEEGAGVGRIVYGALHNDVEETRLQKALLASGSLMFILIVFPDPPEKL
jgi:hypothetical protein